MDALLNILQQTGTGLGFAVVALLCLAGVVLSCLSLFGTWMIAGAAALTWVLADPGFPGLWTLVAFVLVAAALEGVEALAGTWGVTRRGGSGWAGFAALAGGLLGLILGTAIPVPVVGSLLGMMIGSFALVYAVEYYRLKHSGRAAHIATGAVVARVFVIFLKVAATLAMIVWLVAALILYT